MPTQQEHSQGPGDNHLTSQQEFDNTNTATRSRNGLMPAGTIYEGIWVDPPLNSHTPGKEGMRAFDENWYYSYTNGVWRRAPLRDF